MELIEIQTYIREISEGYIDWGEAFTNFRSWMPPFEARITLFIGVVILFIVLNVFHIRKVHSKKEKRTTLSYSQLKKFKIPGFKKRISFTKLTEYLGT